MAGGKPAAEPGDLTRRRDRRLTILALLAFVVVFTTLEVDSLRRKSATFDEPIHLTAGYLAAKEGDYRVDPSHPPLVRMWAALPLLAMGDVPVDTGQIDRMPEDAWLQQAYPFASRFLYREPFGDRLLYAARFMIVIAGLALGLLVFAWAREWLGVVPAILALAFYTIEPNVSTHARLVTTDFAAALFMFATVYFLWRTSRQPGRANIAALTGSCALAFVTKFSAVLLVPIVAVLMVAAVILRTRLTPKLAVAIAGLLAASTFVAIWAAYDFRYAPSASGGWRLHVHDSTAVHEEAPFLGGIVEWVDARRILPNAFTEGFLMSQASARQTAYLAGEYSEDGWWYYFPVVFLLKTPSALVILIAAGAILLIRRRRHLGIGNELFVVVPVMVYMAFAMASGINLGVRHILPIYPFLLLIAVAAARWLMTWRQPMGRVVLGGLIAFWGASFVRVYPDTLTFFTLFSGGPAEGLDYLADSNLDWGQDLKSLKHWMRDRRIDHISLAYFGSADPEYYDIDSTFLPGTPYRKIEKPALPGYVAISATILSGVYLSPQWRLFYQGFLDLEPVDRIGNSIYVYRIDRWPEVDDNPLAADAAVQASLGDALLFDLGWTNLAIEHYREAFERRPDDPAIAEKLGLSLLNTGRLDEAIATLQRAAVLDPDDGDTRYRLALALFGDDQAKDAAQHAAAAVRLKPNDAPARDLLGMTLAATGHLAAAKEAFEKALLLAPGDREIRDHLRRVQLLASRNVRPRGATPQSRRPGV